MNYPFTIVVNDFEKAGEIKNDVQIGHYFVFKTKTTETEGQGRFKRLLVNQQSRNVVFPLIDTNTTVHLDGVTINPVPRAIENMGCIVSDRDLYRAEQDIVRLFIAFPKPPQNLELIIKHNGEFLTKRQVKLEQGVGIETLSMLLAGSYTAQLSISDRLIGTPVSFTVAEYTLAPLSAQLISHELKRDEGLLYFELAVESYQKPFKGELLVTLIGAKEVNLEEKEPVSRKESQLDPWAEQEEQVNSQMEMLFDLHKIVDIYIGLGEFETAANKIHTAIRKNQDSQGFCLKLERMLAEVVAEASSAGVKLNPSGETTEAKLEALKQVLKKDKRKGLLPQSNGHYVGSVEIPYHYAGSIKVWDEGPFRLRVVAVEDAERVAEVAIPGSRKTERQTTRISELGKELFFSMMPEAKALPLRGGYLTEGDFIATPLIVKEIVTKEPAIQVNTNVESLVLINLDLTSGDYKIQKVGSVSAGDNIPVKNCESMNTIFVGAFVDGRPFETYTTFVRPNTFQITLKVPKTVRPRTDLSVKLSCNELKNKQIPVLVCIRDQRLTASDKPEVNLGASAKRNIESAHYQGHLIWNWHNYESITYKVKKLFFVS